MLTFQTDLLLRGQYHDWLVHGLAVSLELTGVALAGALPVAVGIALLRLAPSKALRAVGACYVEGMRNVPLLAHLLFWYFGAPELLPDRVKTWLYAGDIELTSAAIALALYIASYMAEDIRSGVRAVPKAQAEAARALGLSYVGTMRHVVLPQALRVTVPPLVSQTLNLWKDSSVATVVGAGELMYQAARVETATFRGTEAFAFATAAYLGVSLVITGVAAWVHHRFAVRS